VIALHAVWSHDSRLCVWGEDATLPPRGPRRRGRPPRMPRARPHPFGCATADVIAGLEGLDLVPAGEQRTLRLMLPSSKDGPLASPRLLREADGRRVPEGLDAWEAPALALAPAAAVDVLLGLPSTCPPQVAVGESLRFRAEAAKLGLELVARGRILPDLARSGDAWVARWRPFTGDPDDAERVRLLVRAMPALVRAEYWISPEGNPPVAVVGDLLAAVVDACARRFLAGSLSGRSARGARRQSAVDAWLTALTTPDAVVSGEERRLAALSEKLAEWRDAGLRDAEQRSFRTCFRLSAPDDADAPGDSVEASRERSWRVEILVQAKDDPSVLVAAHDVWSSNGGGLTILGRRLVNPQERLLGGLGHALRLWPELEPALGEAAPTGVDLSPGAAFRFLREAAPALEQAGYAVLAPAWWGARVRPKLCVSVEEEGEEGRGLLGLDGLCAYEWQVSVGDVTLTVAELRELAALKLPLVKARGRWAALRPEDVDAALAFFARREERGEASAGELLRAGLGVDAAHAGLPEVEIEAGGWLRELMSVNGERKLQPLSAPAAFVGELRPLRRSASRSSPSSGRCSACIFRSASGARCCSCTAARRRRRAMRWSSASRRPPDRRCSCCR
jgi:hypothetical protein